MAKFTFEEYEQAQERKSNAQQKPLQSVSYFGLKNDGDEALVRFIYKNPSEFDLVSVHQVKVGDRFRRINCLRTPKEPLDKCPLCAAEDKTVSTVRSKFFVKLIEYVRGEDGTVTASPRIWERTPKFAQTLAGYFAEYGDLSDMVFKVKRHGAAGSMETYYDVIPGNPMIYKPEVYVKDFSAFDTYSLSRFVVLDKTAEEMKTYLETGEFPEEVKQTEKPAVSTVSENPRPAAPVAETKTSEEFPASTDSARPVRRYVF